jgi:integrase
MEGKMKTLEVLEKVLRGKRISAMTKRHYCEVLSSLAKYEAEWPVSGVVINEWLASLNRFSDSTIKMWFDYANAAGKYMKKAYNIDNPCESADRPKVAKKKRRYFKPDEMVAIVRACINDFERALILTLIDSTCRIGELVNLKGGDIGDGFINVKGKTGERRYRLEQAICVKLREMAGGNSEPVFKGKSGGFFCDGSTLGHRVRSVIERAGIGGAKLGPHTLRHSGASLVARETGSALAVKALLQHDNIDTSMSYIHDAEDAIQQRISPLRLLGEQYFGKTGESLIEAKQLTMGVSGEVVGAGSTALVPVEQVADDSGLFDDMFPEIPDGMAVRSVLRSEDLRLIREAFMVYAEVGKSGSGAVRARELLKRMMRKGGSEFYAKK